MTRKEKARLSDLAMFTVCAGIFAGVLISRAMGYKS